MGWADISEDTAHQVIKSALEAGVRRFDTADAYGLGLSERRLGRAVEGVRRDTIQISSKVGYLQPTDGTSLWRRDNLRKALDGSLERLGTDYLDTYFVHHNSLAPAEMEQLAGALDTFRNEGLIRRVGMRGPHRFSLERGHADQSDKRAQYSAVESSLKPDVISLRANLLTPPKGIEQVYGWARKERTDIQLYKPLGQGLLTSAFPVAFPNFGDRDHRSKKAWFAPQAHPALQRLHSRIMSIVPEHSVMETALSWVLTRFPEASVVIGSANPMHVLEWPKIRLPIIDHSTLVRLEGEAIRYREEVPQYLD